MENYLENSSIIEKQRKLYIKINSLISSAENFEALKLYDDSLKHYTEANELVKSLAKRSIIDDNTQLKLFFNFFETNVKNKIKVLEHIVYLKKSLDENNIIQNKSKSNSITSILATDTATATNSHLISSSKESKIDPFNKLKTHNNEEIIKNIMNILKRCEMNLKEIEDNKKNISNSNNFISSNSIVLETTIINQNSFYIPNIDNKQINPGFIPVINHLENEDNLILLNKLEENFKIIFTKLNKMKLIYETETKLKEKKGLKQEKLEKIKNSYAAMKKIYENAIRTGKLKKV